MQSLWGVVGGTLALGFGLAIGCGSSTNDSPVVPVPVTSDGGGGGAESYWYITSDTFKVGTGDLAGNAYFTDTLTDKPMKIVIGGGSAWVLTVGGTVVRYDETTHAKLATITVAKTPSFLVFAAGAVWVSDDDDDGTMGGCSGDTVGNNQLDRIDPASNSVVARFNVNAVGDTSCTRFDSLATDGTNVYALLDGEFGIARIDTTANAVAAKIALGAGGGSGSGFAVATSDAVWVHDVGQKTLAKLVPMTLAIVSTTPLTGATTFLGEHMVATPDAIYLDQPASQILRIDAASPTTQTAVMTLDNSPDAMVIHAGQLYATYTESFDAQVVAYDETTLATGAKTSGQIFPDGIAFIE